MFPNHNTGSNFGKGGGGGSGGGLQRIKSTSLSHFFLSLTLVLHVLFVKSKETLKCSDKGDSYLKYPSCTGSRRVSG